MTKAEEYRQAAIIFVLMILVFFWPLFKGKILSQADTVYFFPPWNSVKPSGWAAPSNSVLNDQTREFLTFFQVAKESLQRMELPLWNPYIMAGTPLLANSQSALFFPLNWPFYFLPLYLGVTVSALLKVLIASMGTYAFCRKLALSHPAAILSGTVYTFSIFNIFWLNHPHTNATIFFPWLLLWAERTRENPSPSAMALLGLTVGVQLMGGHVEITFQIAFAVTLFFLFRLIDYWKDWKALILRLKIFLGGYTLGFFLAGVLMIPFLEFLSQSATWQVRSGENPFFLQPIGFLSFFFSDFFAKVEWPFDISAYHSLSLYAGISPLILGILTFTLRPQRISIFFAGLSLMALDIVFGLPPLFPFITSLPLFKQAPNYYMVLFHILSVSLLGGMGLDWVGSGAKDQTPDKKRVLILVSASFIILFLMTSFILLVANTSFLSQIYKGLEGLPASALGRILSQVGTSLARSSFFAGLTFVVIVGAFWIRRVRGIWRILVIGVTFADLFIAGSGWNPLIPVHWANPSPPPAIQFLSQDKDIYRVAGLGPVLAPNLATLCNLQDVRGYDVPVGHRYHIFFQKALKGKTAWWIYEFPKLEMESMPFLSLLNVKYLLSLNSLPPSLSLIYDGEVKVYKNPEAFPRAFLVHQVETAKDGPDALERVMALGPRLRQVAVLEGSLPELLSGLPLAEKDKAMEDRVQIRVYTAQRVEIEIDASSPGLLILGDTYFPGWQAEIDGKKVPVFRANYLLKGIAVDQGIHRIAFFYQPFSFYFGLGLTVLAGGVIAWCLMRKRR
jgi:hypothetical protein